MKKLLSLLFILSVTCVLSFAQNGESKKEETNSNAPPPQLSDEMHTWMIGEWAGTTESNMGTSKDWEKMEWGAWQTVCYYSFLKSNDKTQYRVFKNTSRTNENV